MTAPGVAQQGHLPMTFSIMSLASALQLGPVKWFDACLPAPSRRESHHEPSRFPSYLSAEQIQLKIICLRGLQIRHRGRQAAED